MNELSNVITIQGVDCYEKNGVAYLKLETVARGLGFTQGKGDCVYVRWDRVEGYLVEMGFPHKWGKEDFIPENVFYRLAMKAKNGAAEKFQALIADEVIPAIRKHGAYMTQNTIEKVLSDPDTIIKLATDLKNERERRKALETQAVLDKPKVIFADAVAASSQCILIGDLAKLLHQNGIETGQKRLFQWMRENGYLICQHGMSYNMPTQKSMEMGLFKIKETAITHADGHTSVARTIKVTGKGQEYFISKFLSEKDAGDR